MKQTLMDRLNTFMILMFGAILFSFVVVLPVKFISEAIHDGLGPFAQVVFLILLLSAVVWYMSGRLK